MNSERGASASICLALSLSFAMFLPACTSLHLKDLPTATGLSWPTEGRTNERSYEAPAAPTLPLRMEWDYNAAAGFGPGGPLVAEPFVLVATRKGEVHAIDAERGKKKGVKAFGDAIEGSPAVLGGVLYVPVAWGRRTGVVAYDLISGSRLWRYEAPPVTTGLLATDEVVIFGDYEAQLHCLDHRGSVRWTFQSENRTSIKGTPVMVVAGTVAVADDQGILLGVDLSEGTLVWRRDLGEPVYVSMASGKGRLLVPTTRGTLHALDGVTGQTLWVFHGDNLQAKYATPAVAGETVVFGGSDGVVRALNLNTGDELWSWRASGAITSAPVIADGLVFLGTMSAFVYALDLSNGRVLWEEKLRGRVKSAPTVSGSSVYFQGEPRYVYRFTSEVSGSD